MLKTVSAMIENYDTQMVDYIADIDMQMQAFSSTDPWLHDEVYMEEDAPGVKLENFAHLKGDQGDLTIEIDMEEHNSAEYDMVDDEQHHAPELLDIEVYDASLAHSPAVVPFDPALSVESAFAPLASSPGPQNAATTDVSQSSTAVALATTPVAPVLPLPEEVSVASVPDLHEDVPPNDDEAINTASSNAHLSVSPGDTVEPFEDAPSADPAQVVSTENVSSSDVAVANRVVEKSQDQTRDPAAAIPQSGLVEELNSAAVVLDEDPQDEAGSSANVVHVESTSGDPHEISEGVYIDPPPPVLLSVASADQEFELSFFNKPAEWDEPSTEHRFDSRILLHHLPTLYYDSLSSLFEALRRDERIQSAFHLHDTELVLQAVDLALTISEDNIYAREVTLHDLNILHDASGIAGPLRTRLYTSTPRFIVQYQQLQEHVSRLQLEQQSRGISFGSHTEIQDNQQSYSTSVAESTDNQDLPEGGVAHTEEGDTEANAKGDEKLESEETEAVDVRLMSKNSQEQQVADTQTDEDDNEGEEALEQEDRNGDSRTEEEESPADSHPAVEDGTYDRDGTSAHTEEAAAVIGLDALEAEANELQSYEDEYGDDVSEHVHDGEGGDKNVADNGQGPDGSVENTLQEEGADYAADGTEEELHESGEYEQGDDLSHEQSEYAEAEDGSEPAPDQNQAFPEHKDDEPEGSVKNIDNTFYLANKTDGQEYEDETLPELPTDPISFDNGNWGQEFEELGDDEETWNDADNENSGSNHSSVTLSSRASKRTYDEYESDDERCEEDGERWHLPSSPDPKRSRTE